MVLGMREFHPLLIGIITGCTMALSGSISFGFAVGFVCVIIEMLVPE